MQQAAQPGSAEAHGEQDANEVDDGDLRKDERAGREDSQHERQQESAKLPCADGEETEERFLKRGAEVLGKALPGFPKRAVHPHGGKLERVAVEQAHPLAYPRSDGAAEGYVFHEVIVDGGVPADAVVGGAGEEHELTIRRAENPPRPCGHARREVRMVLQKAQEPVRIHGHAEEDDHGDDEPFAAGRGQERGPRRD